MVAMTHRRGFVKWSLAAALTLAGVSARRVVRAAGHSGGPVVVVRQSGRLVAVDPGTGDSWSVGGIANPVTATSTAGGDARAAGDAAIDRLDVDGEVDYWMSSPGHHALLYRARVDGAATWWWRNEHSSMSLPELPPHLEPQFPAGGSGRWFHGARISAEHLGAGELRLIAVDLEDGSIVLDQIHDRRLELAATAVSDEGAIVAHAQAGNTQVELWATDLRFRDASIDLAVGIDAAPVAASAIDLHVAGDGDEAVIAAGLAWHWPEHPNPMVVIAMADRKHRPVATKVAGELIGIVPASKLLPSMPAAPFRPEPAGAGPRCVPPSRPA